MTAPKTEAEELIVMLELIRGNISDTPETAPTTLIEGVSPSSTGWVITKAIKYIKENEK